MAAARDGRLDEAAACFADVLPYAPQDLSLLTALMSVEQRRGRSADALRNQVAELTRALADAGLTVAGLDIRRET